MVLPSAFMRQLRPEYYSDSQQTGAYVLSATGLEYHLDSITSRNQTHDFEIFCRKLCERTICPNLRPQTGPDGGGDSKADTETYPVADEISGLTYVGSANGGRERWAFAFSAKATWAAKVRKDAKELAATGRQYQRIICVTSRFAKAKTRAQLEDELSKEYGVPLTIHDRSWIVKEVIENDRIDLAVNYLKVGEVRPDAVWLGPNDYSRAQQLADIERAIADPDAYRGMERHLVTEALVAAKLSRSLERPRVEIDGRFARAVRLAEQHGSYRQKLEATYEHIWTGFWWFDDFLFVNTSYDGFEERALASRQANDIAFLGNLHQLLVNMVVHGHMSREECRFEERTTQLRQALEPLVQDTDRPNNSLEARTELLRIELNLAMMAKDRAALSALWPRYGSILDDASGLGEFDADTLVRFIEAIAPGVGNDSGYNDLVEKLAAFVGARKNDGEGALILLRRAKTLDLSDWPDMIRWLGKAAVGLYKREYTPSLVESVYLLAVAYRHARLPWAARASCATAAASLVMQGEEDSMVPSSFVPTLKVWAWVALDLRHIPDFLFAIQLLNGCLRTLPLSDASKARVEDDLRELALALGCLFLNLKDDDLRKLERLPDILEGLELFTARIALLYVLGHEDVLRTDGSLPPEETDNSVRALLAKLKGQPIAKDLKGPLVLNEDAAQVMTTTLVGMKVEVEVPDQRSIPVGEAVLGCLEAFFATALDRATPHVESFRITVTPSGEMDAPRIATDKLGCSSVITWPMAVPVTQPGRQDDMRKFFLEVAAQVMGATCMVDDPEAFLEDLCTNESVLQRLTMVVASSNSFNRVTSHRVMDLSAWALPGQKSYPLRHRRTELPDLMLPGADDDLDKGTATDGRPKLSHHREARIVSVIDVHAWNEAHWRGCGYPYPLSVPAMSLLFENPAAARRIFERWRERFGREDVEEEINISIIRGLPDQSPHHYCVQITARHPEEDSAADARPTFLTSRSTIMEPTSSENLDRFLEQ